MNKNTDWDNIINEMADNSYPPNQSFDPRFINDLYCRNTRMMTIAKIFPDLVCHHSKPHTFNSLLDVGCNKGLFSFAFKDTFMNILGIDPMVKMINIAQKIRNTHGLSHIEFLNTSFEKFPLNVTFDIVHFGQCSHYLFRDAVRNRIFPLTFLHNAIILAKKYILIDGAFEGDPSVEFDAQKDSWSKDIKDLATIEGYAKALRPQFRLLKYGWSGDGATRFLAVFQRICK
jgi:SAM-dependent methyltransferase